MTRFARNTVFSSLAGLSSALGGLYCSVVAARILGAGGSGTVVYVLWLVTVAATVSDLGTAGSLTRFLPELTSREDHALVPGVVGLLFRPACLTTFLMAGVAGLLMTFGGDVVLPHQADARFEILAFAAVVGLCVTQSLSNFFLSTLRGLQEFDRVAKIILASMISQIVCVSVGGWWLGVPGVLAGYVAGTIWPALLVLASDKSKTPVPAELGERVLRFRLYTWAASLTSLLVWSRIEIVFLKHFSGDAAVGLFAVGLTLANLAVQGPLLLTGGILAFFSERTRQEDRLAVDSALNLGMRLIAAIVLPLTFGLCALAPEIIPLFYGRGFEGAVLPAIILIIAAGFSAVGVVPSTLLYAYERSDVVLYCNVGGGLLSVVGCLVVIPYFDLVGAAVCRAAVQFCMLAAGFWFVVRRLGFSLPFNHIARLTLSAAFCAACARLCLVLIPGPVGLPFAIIGGALGYGLSVRALSALPASDLARLSALSEKAPRLMRQPAQLIARLLVGV